MYKTIKYSSVAVMLLLMGCSPIAEPTIPPSRVESATTSYSQILPKFNQMIMVFNNQEPINVIIDSIENKTGNQDKLPVDITAIVRSSLNSIGKSVKTISNESKIGNRDCYIIHGVISDFSIIKEEYSGSEGSTEFGKGKGNTTINGSRNGESKLTKLSIVLNPSGFTSGDFISRASVSNSIEIHQKSNAKEFSIFVFGTGGGLNKSMTKSHGVGSSIKTLVDLSTIEMLGKIKKFPYWLLTKTKSNQDIINHLTDKFLDDKPYQQIYKISYLLSLKNRMLQPTKIMNKTLKEAIINHKQTHNIRINTHISQELYKSLLEG
jgi:hypothetical protein